jgi:GAG-pre-integrase domain
LSRTPTRRSPPHFSNLQALGQGVVRWSIATQCGQYRHIEATAFYCPSATGSLPRIVSPQQYAQYYKENNDGDELELCIRAGQSILRSVNNTSAPIILVEYSSQMNLPISQAFYSQDAPSIETKATALHEFNLCVTATANQNLSEAQKEKLRWHFQLGHISFEAVDTLPRSGVLAQTDATKKLHKAAANSANPKCASCQFGKACRRPQPGCTTAQDPSNVGELKKDHLFPGQCVSVDHFVCSTKGRLYMSRGKTSESTMYSGGAIFVDHASKLIFVEHQVNLTTHETLLGKHKFEAFARESGVVVQQYQANNGIFRSKDFGNDLTALRQMSTFAGVGAHHQNGVAERSIRTVMNMARTMMLHAAIRWPDVADTCLWPLAVDYAVYIHNHIPNPRTGQAPIDVSRTKWPQRKCVDFHVWGSPTYVLDPALQDGKKLPKWKTRSRRAVYLGLSKNHSSWIPLVLNLTSHSISPQYHCVHDDWFTTVTSSGDIPVDLSDPRRTHLFSNSRYQYPFDDDQQVPNLGPE